MSSFICSPGKEGCEVKCFGLQGLYNHAHVYVGSVYVCAVAEKGTVQNHPRTPSRSTKDPRGNGSGHELDWDIFHFLQAEKG